MCPSGMCFLPACCAPLEHIPSIVLVPAAFYDASLPLNKLVSFFSDATAEFMYGMPARREKGLID